MVASDLVLVHLSSNLPILVSCDVSPFGLEGTLSHVYPDKSERPVMFVSCTLVKLERNYAQIDREALVLYWRVTKCNHFS